MFQGGLAASTSYRIMTKTVIANFRCASLLDCAMVPLLFMLSKLSMLSVSWSHNFVRKISSKFNNWICIHWKLSSDPESCWNLDNKHLIAQQSINLWFFHFCYFKILINALFFFGAAPLLTTQNLKRCWRQKCATTLNYQEAEFGELIDNLLSKETEGPQVVHPDGKSAA